MRSGVACRTCPAATVEQAFVRKLIWVGVAAFTLSLVIGGWILTSAGLFGLARQEKLGPETSFTPDAAKR
jgi:hypothetical protein